MKNVSHFLIAHFLVVFIEQKLQPALNTVGTMLGEFFLDRIDENAQIEALIRIVRVVVLVQQENVLIFREGLRTLLVFVLKTFSMCLIFPQKNPYYFNF